MTTVRTTVTINISPNAVDSETLEAQISKTVQHAGRYLLLRAAKGIETEGLDGGTDLRRSKRRELHLLTRFGWIRLRRYQVRSVQGRFFYPLDHVLGLVPPCITIQGPRPPGDSSGIREGNLTASAGLKP